MRTHTIILIITCRNRSNKNSYHDLL